jgi:hypothetical protein
MVKCGVLFEVRIEFLNIIYTSFGVKELITISSYVHSLSQATEKQNLVPDTAQNNKQNIKGMRALKRFIRDFSVSQRPGFITAELTDKYEKWSSV